MDYVFMKEFGSESMEHRFPPVAVAGRWVPTHRDDNINCIVFFVSGEKQRLHLVGLNRFVLLICAIGEINGSHYFFSNHRHFEF
jgi:hypothetical protein